MASDAERTRWKEMAAKELRGGDPEKLVWKSADGDSGAEVSEVESDSDDECSC